ncbi:helix-turn-helix domain-containing protein [Aminipila terrae]|uniref:Helix-turn-helix domain-containing protein n=1 Tax=Aminipila terrae TaxID=2697030 RepID=A0A6P1MH49_9FIRM|nr:AraC family transcriptional regulator [Aminipila terrae]QHI74030.1 helix-turn-helix domain-containing protein [Aminipila terrae]
MQPTSLEKSLYGDDVKILSRRDDMAVYLVTDKTGSAKMTSYQVFEGIDIIYNDVHMQKVHIDIKPSQEMFEINHCNEGRIECEFHNGDYLYMAEGDFSVNRKDGYCHKSYFPLSHYHGVSIAITPKTAQKEIDCQFGENKINIEKICNSLCGRKGFFLARQRERIKHIFFELYCVPEQIKKDIFKLKVLEIILILSTLEGEYPEQKTYFPRMQVEKIKSIHKQITEHLDKKYTLEQLAKEHDIALTSMKNCFKGVFGSGIYAYVKKYRMHAAAQMLLETDHNVLEIANCVGYENGSKFAAAFKDIIGVSPSVFRESKNGYYI